MAGEMYNMICLSVPLNLRDILAVFFRENLADLVFALEVVNEEAGGRLFLDCGGSRLSWGLGLRCRRWRLGLGCGAIRWSWGRGRSRLCTLIL